MGAQDVNLIGNQLDRYAGAAALGLGIGDVDVFQLYDAGLERFTGGLPLIDRGGKGIVDLVAEQRAQLLFVAGGKGADNQLEGAARAIEEVRRVELRIGGGDLRETGSHRARSRRSLD